MVKSYSASLNNVAASLNNGAKLKSWKVPSPVDETEAGRPVKQAVSPAVWASP